MQQIMPALLPCSIEHSVGYMLKWKLAVFASGTMQVHRKGGLNKLEAVRAQICSHSNPYVLEGVVPVMLCIACRDETGSLQE